MAATEDSQNETLALFKNIAALDDNEVARAILSAHNWNIERAVDAFLTRGVEGALQPPNRTGSLEFASTSDTSGTTPDASELSSAPVSGQLHASRLSESQPLTPALAETSTPERALQPALAQATPSGVLGHLRRLLAFPFQALRMVLAWCASLVTRIMGIDRYYRYAGRSRAVGAAAVAELEENLRTRYGMTIRYPTIYHGTFKEALEHSTQRCKLVLLYLHSEIHHATDRFVREILSDESFIQFVNENFVFYAASVNRSPEAVELASYFTPAGYPYLAVVFASHRWPLGQLIDLRVLSDLDRSMRGGRDAPITATDVLLWLQNVLLEYGDALRTAHTMRERRRSAQRLREEQDREFQEALAADQAAERARREFEQRAREEAAEQDQRRRERMAMLDRKRAALGPEPEPGEHVVTVLLRLPDGKSTQRRFELSRSFRDLFDWAETSADIDFDRFELTTNFPKRAYSPASHSAMTLAEAGFKQRVALLVTEIGWTRALPDASGKADVSDGNGNVEQKHLEQGNSSESKKQV